MEFWKNRYSLNVSFKNDVTQDLQKYIPIGSTGEMAKIILESNDFSVTNHLKNSGHFLLGKWC
jgi:hypothetical protein